METVSLAVALILLLTLNAFFVLAEFAIVKVRPSRIIQLMEEGSRRARILADVHKHLDEYLSVCQVGITLASVALGMVGERMASMIMGTEQSTFRYVLAMGVSYLLISGSHILLGELVPKSIAIRIADRAAIRAALPLRVFHMLFFPALWILTSLSNGILRLMRFRRGTAEERHSERELRIILDESQEHGVMSFRRLLFMENVFDFGTLVVRDTMRGRAQVKTLDARNSWAANLEVIRSSHFTRYPLIETNPDRPAGFLHVKDLVLHDDGREPELTTLARPLLATTETTPLETLFAEMQRRRIQVALVTNAAGEWTGFVTFEDVIEELVGTIRDEFEDEEPINLADAITAPRIHFNIEADTPLAAVKQAISRMAPDDLPLPASWILQSIETRDRLAGTYVGHGFGIPHARVAGLNRPLVMILHSVGGIACDASAEKAHLMFVLLTPAGQPRVHQRMLGLIAALVHESEYVKERLLSAETAEEVMEIIRTGEQSSLD